MATREQVTETFVNTLSTILEKPAEEIRANLGASFKEDYGMTSLQYFPLIGEMEDVFDVEMDYSGFLMNAKTVQEGIDFVCKAMEG